MKEILINSKVHGLHIALVDDEDYELANQYKWYVNKLDYVCHKSMTHGSISLHRLIMGFPKGKCIDHIDGNPLNNQRSNLRVCTQAENTKNRSIQKGNKSGYKGVYFSKLLRKYRGQIKVNGKIINLGSSSDPITIATRYNELAIKYYGEFAKLNKIPCVVA